MSWGLGLMLTSNAVLALSRIGLDKVIVKRGVVPERIIDTDPPGNSIEDSDLLAVPRAWSRPDAD